MNLENYLIKTYYLFNPSSRQLHNHKYMAYYSHYQLILAEQPP